MRRGGAAIANHFGLFPGRFVSFPRTAFGNVRRCLAVAALLAPVLFGCATPPTDPAALAAYEQTNDPLEPTNRKILEANMVLDKILFRPVAKVYVTILPDEARDAIKRVLDNLKEPVVAINNVLEARPKSAGVTVERFGINSTVGILGLFDVAKKWGLDRQPADFGQTLYVWGFKSGPYLVLPVFGPSNVRDSIGMGVDAYMDPFDYLATRENLDPLQIGRYVLDGIDQRARVLDVLDDLQKNSLDFYAELRSLSQQQRATELSRGKTPDTTPNFYSDPGKAGAAPTPASAPAPAPSVSPDFYTDPGKPATSSPAPKPSPVPTANAVPPPAAPPAPTRTAAPGPPPAPGSMPADFEEGPLRGSAGS
jgi:phospholipid-binding lipoprotein MlaA